MPEPACPAWCNLEVTFICEVCFAEKPARDAVRIPLDSPAHHADVCRACYADGVAAGIIDPVSGDFAD
jgi:hypothetical protein